MAVDGSYNVEMNSPMGTRTGSLILNTDGNSLTGTVYDEQGEHTLEDGKVAGDEFSFNLPVSTPMGEIKLSFKGSLSGDTVSGDVQIGDFGSYTFKGSRS